MRQRIFIALISLWLSPLMALTGIHVAPLFTSQTLSFGYLHQALQIHYQIEPMLDPALSTKINTQPPAIKSTTINNAETTITIQSITVDHHVIAQGSTATKSTLMFQHPIKSSTMLNQIFRKIKMPAFKRRFITRMHEAYHHVYAQIMQIRTQLSAAQENIEETLVKQWVEQYYIDTKRYPTLTQQIEQLRNRVDIWPFSLMVAQAILESGWGQSRFAKQGNNYFGIWCFTAGCGIVPKQRDQNKTHEVKLYQSLQESMSDYMLILNRLYAYELLRTLRNKMRLESKTYHGLALLPGLEPYAESSTDYLNKLNTIIIQNQLEKLD